MSGEPTNNDIMQCIKAFTEEQEKKMKGMQDGLGALKQEKAKEELDIALKASQERIQQEIATEKKQKEQETAIMDAEQRIKSLESKLFRPNASSASNESDEMEAKALRLLLKHREGFAHMEERKYLRTDNDVSGGYLAPQTLSNRIIEKIIEVSPIRSLATVNTIQSKSIEIPTEETDASVFKVGEGGTYTESEPTFGKKTIVPKKYGVIVPMTQEFLDDSGFNVENFIQRRVVRKFAQQEGVDFILGTGVNEPEGLLGGTLPQYASGLASTIDIDSLLKIQGVISSEYKSDSSYVFLMNRKTFYENILTLKSDDANLYFLNNQGSPLDRISGVRYVIAEDMPDVAANSYPIILGNIAETYNIIDRVGLSIFVNPYTSSNQDIVTYRFSKRTGGAIVLPEASVKMKIATSV